MPDYAVNVVLAAVPVGNVLIPTGSTVVSYQLDVGATAAVAAVMGNYVPRQSTAPDPSVAPAYIDTSVTPPALKGWNGTAFVAIGGGSGSTITPTRNGDGSISLVAS